MSDDSRSIELEVEVPGTPVEIWAAVATGPGIGSWFVPSTVEEREGGETVSQFGPGESMSVRGRVRVWDPPHRVVFDGSDESGGMAFEWLIEARDGGTCVVRLVNSGFGSGEEWNDQFDGLDAGWRMFLHNLSLHRRYFPGQVGVAVQPLGMAAVGLDEAWGTLTGALGIPAASTEGDRVAAGPEAPTALAGTVERAVPRQLTLRIDEPGPGTAVVAVEGTDGQAAISVWFWLYGPDASDRAPAVLEGWQGWLADLFPTPD
ncbi:MAG: hypothetical protein QOH68_2142 [Nocardioidaceae bacterium]|nr:hypothetical protein [Nocardioidaceae bacterium]